MSESTELVLPLGFRAAAVKAGIKPSGGLDLAVLASDRDCSAAGTFTTNRVAAAPVQWDRALLPSAAIRGVRHQLGQRQRGDRPGRARQRQGDRRGGPRPCWDAGPIRSSWPRPA